jgi:hypothetical protein
LKIAFCNLAGRHQERVWRPACSLQTMQPLCFVKDVAASTSRRRDEP